MRSIRLSLVVYVLALLAVALGAVSLLVFHTVHQTLLAKKAATKALLEAQYRERCRKEEAKFDQALTYQAQTLLGLTGFQMPARLHYREHYAYAGLVAALANPDGQFLAAGWLAEGARPAPPPRKGDRPEPPGGELSWKMASEWFRQLGGKAEITIDENLLRPGDDGQAATYFQINSVWGSTYRSRSLGNRSLPFDRAVFGQDLVLTMEFDDVQLDPGRPLRRVLLKAPPANLIPFWGGPRGGRHRAGPPEPPPQPVVIIQVAADTKPLDAAVAEFAAQRDEALARLDEETDASLVALRNRLLLIAVAAFAASALGGLCLVRLGLAPLQRLSEAVSRVSPKDFRLPFEEKRLPEELTAIVKRLTETLGLLKRAFAREKQAAADISHDLRTPLAALLTTIDVALRKPRRPEEYRETLAECRESGQQMNRLVERLLTLARLDAGVDRLRPQSVDVAQLAEQCAALVRPLAEARALTLDVRHDSPGPVTADPDKLREVLTNLLHNAIEYNRPAGRVEVAVTRDNGRLRLEVSDTGIGIAPEAREHIFERFYRADPSRQTDGMHTGLGLAIVKGYVDLMGGRIDVDSAEGQGSTFRVELPAQ
jgi:two-component system, OmpR family, heavy metal sensor histidine kinase CusS